MHALSLYSLLFTGLVTLATGAELLRRQDSQAVDDIPIVRFGEDCTDSFGENFEWCGPEEARYCYDPTAGDTCCYDTDDPWACGTGLFCLVEKQCCPDGLDPATCAAENGVTLPPDFSIDNNNDEDVVDDVDVDVDDIVDEAEDAIEGVEGFDDVDDADEDFDDDGVIGIIPDDGEAAEVEADETIIDTVGLDPSPTLGSSSEVDSDTPAVFEGAANSIAFGASGLVLGLLCFAGILL